MAINIVDIVKDNKQIFIALGGLVIVVLAMSYVSATGSNLFQVSRDISQGKLPKFKTYSSAPTMKLKSGFDYQARIKTSHGDILINLYEEETPVAVNNFVFLARESFYNNLKFVYVDEGRLIQTGDPVGDGSGGPGYVFDDEIRSDLEFGPYTVAMSNSGRDTNGSQFFITSGQYRGSDLDGKYVIFGKVIDGFEVVDKIEGVEIDEYGVPKTDVLMKSVAILEK